MLFDIRDFRLPWTRTMDGIGDIVIRNIKNVLDMDSLLDDRRKAIQTMGSGSWPGAVMTPVFQGIQYDVYTSSDLLVMFKLSRDVRTSGTAWRAHFTVFGEKLLYPRQLLRIRQALEQFVQEQPHLKGLVITPGENDIQIDVTAQIGQIVEPE
jgi:hypothetical protein